MALCASLALAGCGPPVPPEVAAGARHFQAACAPCHGRLGQGLPRLGAPLRDSEFVRRRSDEELVAFLAAGRPASHPDNRRGVDMPPRGGRPDLTDDDLAEIVRYLRTLAPRSP